MAITVYVGLLERTTEGSQEREAVSHSGPWSLGCLPTLHISQSLPMLCILSEPELMVPCILPLVTALEDITSIAYPNIPQHGAKKTSLYLSSPSPGPRDVAWDQGAQRL